MALERGIDDAEPVRPGGVSYTEEERRRSDGVLGEGTLACPRCDVPVALTEEPLVVTSDLGCPFCGHVGAVRDFLSLAVPTRPTRVVVRIRLRARRS